MRLVSHTLVSIVFSVMAASFFATTAVLAWEFWADNRWVDLMAMDSHLFVFFPTFGIISLLAFYYPVVIFLDHYLKHVPAGFLRIALGLTAFVLISWWFSNLILSNENRPVWDVSPSALASDRGFPEGCADDGIGATCSRVPVLIAVSSLRKLSQTRITVDEFERTCAPDPLVQPAQTQRPDRYCVASTPFPPHLDYDIFGRLVADPQVAVRSQRSEVRRVDDETCCAAQAGQVLKINSLYGESADNHSLTGQVHARLLPIKVFFLLLLLGISGALIVRIKGITQFYDAYTIRRVEIGLIVGTIAALFFPLMSQAFLRGLNVLFGSTGQGYFSTMVPILSGFFILWTLVMVAVFIFGREQRPGQWEFIKLGGTAISGGLTLFNYQTIVSWLVFIMGAGAHWLLLSGTGLAALVAAIVVARVLAVDPEPDPPTQA